VLVMRPSYPCSAKARPRALWALIFICISVVTGCSRRTDDDQILFAPKAFTTIGEDYVYAAGTLTGPNLGHTNNSVAVTCFKDRLECISYQVEQIGPNQIGRLDVPTLYRVTNWTTDEIAATEPPDPTACRSASVRIVPSSKTVIWTEIPINRGSPNCASSAKLVFNLTMEDPPDWKALRGK
jgi:hypothetical protein